MSALLVRAPALRCRQPSPNLGQSPARVMKARWRRADDPGHRIVHRIVRTCALRASQDRIMATSTRTRRHRGAGHDWRAAGEAWGSRANDWSCLYEHYSVDVLIALFARLGLGSGDPVLDIACGSGLAVRLADATGATVAGIDAADELVAVARDRTPTPTSASVDVRAALGRRVVRRRHVGERHLGRLRGGARRGVPGAPPGRPDRHQLLGHGTAARHPDVLSHLRPAFAGAAPRLDAAAQRHQRARAWRRRCSPPRGFAVLERGRRTSVIEWPDAEIAWRAIASLGPAVPALRTDDPALLRREVLDALEPCRDPRGIYRTGATNSS